MTEQDPYATLDVPKGASKETVKRAYRKRAKQVHPGNNAGDGEEFLRVHAAYRLLTDDARRARYDRTGRWDDDKPANEQNELYATLSQTLAEVVAGLAAQGVKPETQDVVKLMAGVLDKHMTNVRGQRAAPARAKDGYAALLGRFGGAEGGALEDIVKAHLGQVEALLAEMDKDLTRLGAAKEFLKGAAFRPDPTPQPVQKYDELSSLFAALRAGGM